jgi:hypothetical protein
MIISFIEALFASSYIGTFALDVFVVSVTPKDANRLFRFSSLKLSGNVAEKYSELFVQYLFLSLSMA